MTPEERKRAIQRLAVRGEVSIHQGWAHKTTKEYDETIAGVTHHWTEFATNDTPVWTVTLTRRRHGPFPQFDRFARAAGWLGFGDLQAKAEDLDVGLARVLEDSRPAHVDLVDAVYSRQLDLKAVGALFRVLARAS